MQRIAFQKARPGGRAFFFAAMMSAFALSACSSVTDVLLERDEIAETAAQRGGLTKFFVETGQFELVGYRRFSSTASGEVSIYIEGDGLAYKSANVISRDPTPRDPVSLRMAASDPSPNVAYLSRPCQYQTPARLARCNHNYWATSRFAPVVISETNIAIDAIKQASGAERVRLYGYSGGGVVAALVAAKRSDVAFLATAASPLDHAVWTRSNGFAALRGSLSPVSMVTEIARVPQVHFVGANDDVVQRPVVESYVSKVRAAGGQVQIVDVPGADHTCCWERRWPELYRAWLR